MNWLGVPSFLAASRASDLSMSSLVCKAAQCSAQLYPVVPAGQFRVSFPQLQYPGEKIKLRGTSLAPHCLK